MTESFPGSNDSFSHIPSTPEGLLHRNPDLLFDFQQPFDGMQPEVPRSEQQHAAKIFDTFVDNMMLNHPAETRPSSLSDKGWTRPSQLSLTRIMPDGSIYPISITEGRDDITDELYKAVIITQVSGGVTRATTYQLGEDGVVRRVDSGDVELKAEREKNLDAGARITYGDNEPHTGDMTDEIGDEYDSTWLEEAMGYNNQPVGLDEINNVIDFVDHAEVDVLPLRPNSKPGYGVKNERVNEALASDFDRVLKSFSHAPEEYTIQDIDILLNTIETADFKGSGSIIRDIALSMNEDVSLTVRAQAPYHHTTRDSEDTIFLPSTVAPGEDITVRAEALVLRPDAEHEIIRVTLAGDDRGKRDPFTGMYAVRHKSDNTWNNFYIGYNRGTDAGELPYVAEALIPEQSAVLGMQLKEAAQAVDHRH